MEDLAGNVWEWSLDNNDSLTGTSCVKRGGHYSTNIILNPASARDIDLLSNSADNVEFRPALYQVVSRELNAKESTKILQIAM